jgi:hypothetical protein
MEPICSRIALSAVISLGLTASLCAEQTVPRLIKIDPSEGSVDQQIRFLGENLSKTRSIHFLVKHVDRPAKFRVVSNSELEVTVPEIYRPNAEALVILRFDDGVLLTCPPNEVIVRENLERTVGRPNLDFGTKVAHVLQGGVLPNSSIPTIVERGGIANSVRAECPLLMVKAGGVAGRPEMQTSDMPRWLFYERGAELHGELLDIGWTIIPVRNIHLAEGVGPFEFRAPPIADELKVAKAVPQITAIAPGTASVGDIITVRGKGFSGTSKVYVVCGKTYDAGFRLVSDSELKFESHEGYMQGHVELIVINSKGLAVTESPLMLRQGESMDSHHVVFAHVTSGTTLTSRESHQLSKWPLYLVHKGGTISNQHAKGVFVVKSGGKADINSGKIFYEPGASVSNSREPFDKMEVPVIHVNRLHYGLEYIKN